MRKSSNIIKPEFPFIETSLIVAMIFILGITTIQVLKGSQEHYIIYPIGSVGLIFCYFFANYRNKTVEKRGSDLIVKPIFRKARLFNKSNTKGYEIYETFDYTGLIEQIRLFDLKGNKVIFARDSYKDYDKLLRIIKTSGIKNLGTKKIKWKFKKTYSIIAVISFILAMMMFYLLRLN